MTAIKATLTVTFSVLLSGCVTGPVGPPYLRYQASTEPPGAWVYEEGTPSRSTQYSRRLTDAEIQAGRAEFPKLVFEKPGYKPRVVTPAALALDVESLRVLRSGRFYQNTEKVYLQKDPDYEGPEGDKNKIKLTINSEPQGARIYEEGKFVGVTPLTVEYTIESRNYKAGAVRCKPLVAAHDACLPDRQDVELKVDPDWRYESSTLHEYATLFLLKRDPNYRPPVVVQGQAPTQGDLNVNVRKDKDALDLLQQVGEIGIMIKSLQPIR